MILGHETHGGAAHVSRGGRKRLPGPAETAVSEMRTMTLPVRTDVLVVGGGPAGSSAATFLAKKGYSVVLIDKAHHPRETVGESILPLAWRYFDLLGRIPPRGYLPRQRGCGAGSSTAVVRSAAGAGGK